MKAIKLFALTIGLESRAIAFTISTLTSSCSHFLGRGTIESRPRRPFSIVSASASASHNESEFEYNYEISASGDGNEYITNSEASLSALSRRKLFQQALLGSSIFTSALTSTENANANANANAASSDTTKTISDISIYQVIPDASEKMSPTIKSVNRLAFDNILSLKNKNTDKNNMNGNGGVVWLGEHHNSQKDHNLQVQIVQSIYDQQMKSKLKSKLKSNSGNANANASHNMSIGLEQVQLQFQPFLDDYVAGKITEEQMLDGVQWSTRWQWDYANYRPIFQLARDLSIPLVALNVDSEDLAIVEEYGIQGLSSSQLRRYITQDPKGFGTFLTPQSYKTYSAYVIEPSYTFHQEMGILKNTNQGKRMEKEMSFGNFFSGRIMWDESMASHAYQWTKNNPGGIMVGLIGADHAKFEKGVVGRYKRLVERESQRQRDVDADADADADVGRLEIGNGNKECISVLLNPTLVDSRPPGSVNAYMNASSLSSSYPDQITLQLRYLKEGMGVATSSEEERKLPSSTGGVLPLADYIVIG